MTRYLLAFFLLPSLAALCAAEDYQCRAQIVDRGGRILSRDSQLGEKNPDFFSFNIKSGTTGFGETFFQHSICIDGQLKKGKIFAETLCVDIYTQAPLSNYYLREEDTATFANSIQDEVLTMTLSASSPKRRTLFPLPSSNDRNSRRKRRGKTENLLERSRESTIQVTLPSKRFRIELVSHNAESRSSFSTFVVTCEKVN